MTDAQSQLTALHRSMVMRFAMVGVVTTMIKKITLAIAAFFGAIVGFLLLRKKQYEEIETAINNADEKAKIKAELAKREKEYQLKIVEINHRHAIERLNDEEKKQADKLRDDPAALSRFLVKAGTSKG